MGEAGVRMLADRPFAEFRLTEQTADRIIAMIQLADRSGKYSVRVRQYKPTRSNKQNRLMWKWFGQWAEHYGCSSDEAYIDFKARFVFPLLMRDDDDWVRVAGMAKDDETEAWLVDRIRTSDMNTTQFSEALGEWEREKRAAGCDLAIPPDLYYDALGRPRR